MIVDSSGPTRKVGRRNADSNRFLDASTLSSEDLEWLEEYGEQATAEILAVGRQLRGVTPDLLLRLAGVHVSDNNKSSLDSRLEGVRKLFRAKSRGNQGDKPLTVDAVCNEVKTKQECPLVGMDWLMILTADLVRVEVVDVHGCSRGLTVGVEEFMATGLDGLGIRLSYATPSTSSEHTQQQSNSSRNLNAGIKSGGSGGLACVLPVPRDRSVAGDAPLVTLQPWSSRAKHSRVVSVLCETKCAGMGGKWQSTNPRHIARRQLERLHDAGLVLRSAFKPTFLVLDGGKQQPSRISAEDLQQLFDELNASGIPCAQLIAGEGGNEDESYDLASVQAEVGELVGLDAADAAFRLRNGVREFFALQNDRKTATFMTRPFAEQSTSFMMYRHRIVAIGDDSSSSSAAEWLSPTSDSDHVIVSDGVDFNGAAAAELSSSERHWLAGLQRHAPALAALGAPTVNCYQKIIFAGSKTRCLSKGCALSESDTPTVSIKMMSRTTDSAGNEAIVFFENLHCRAPANPYLILAATVAAGLDGLTHHLEPATTPSAPERDYHPPNTPSSLAEALTALQADEVISGALGTELMAWIQEVKGTELSLLGEAESASGSTALTASATADALSLQRQVYTNFV